MQNELRDRNIVQLRKKGHAIGHIVAEAGVSRGRVRQILAKDKYLEEQRQMGTLRGFGLPARAVHTMIRITGNRNPTVEDLEKWLRDNPSDWEKIVMRTNLAGIRTLSDIREFASSRGILPK